MDREQRTPRMWPQKDSPSFRMLMDMVQGHNVWTSIERASDLDRKVLELRLYGWPVVRFWQKTERGMRWTYGLHKSVIDEAAAEIRRLAWERRH
jgi:hypothetical protein